MTVVAVTEPVEVVEHFPDTLSPLDEDVKNKKKLQREKRQTSVSLMRKLL